MTTTPMDQPSNNLIPFPDRTPGRTDRPVLTGLEQLRELYAESLAESPDQGGPAECVCGAAGVAFRRGVAVSVAAILSQQAQLVTGETLVVTQAEARQFLEFRAGTAAVVAAAKARRDADKS